MVLNVTELGAGVANCPGHFCGRMVQSIVDSVTRGAVFGGNVVTELANGSVNVYDGEYEYTLSECGACPRGTRASGPICLSCDTTWPAYFIIFNSLLLVAYLAIQNSSYENQLVRSPWLAIYTVVDALVSILVALWCVGPKESARDLFKIPFCGIEAIKDWYPYFHNPRPDHFHRIDCASEVAFPAVTLPLLFLAFQALTCLCLRLPLLRILHTTAGPLHRPTIDKLRVGTLHTMQWLVLTAVVFVSCGGVLYYTYPYYFLVLGVIMCFSNQSAMDGHHKKPLAWFASALLLFPGMITIWLFFELEAIHLIWVFLMTFYPHSLTFVASRYTTNTRLRQPFQES
eukprot:m.27694 g.27694  ORF g.27694 m.27694 type:complete len:343 (+) comp8965_c0_seq1:102-1130(+)